MIFMTIMYLARTAIAPITTNHLSTMRSQSSTLRSSVTLLLGPMLLCVLDCGNVVLSDCADFLCDFMQSVWLNDTPWLSGF